MSSQTQSIGSMIAASARLAIGYTQNLLQDIPADKAARFARSGDQVIESNHPTFILGHLSLYPLRVVSELGGDVSTVAPPESFEKLFSREAACLDDQQGTIYPPIEQVSSVMVGGYETAIELLEATEDQAFYAENPIERLREKFPTKGAAHGFYMGGHLMMHLGQLSAWRRAMGMGAA